MTFDVALIELEDATNRENWKNAGAEDGLRQRGEKIGEESF